MIYILFFRFKTSCTLYSNISKIVYHVLWLRMCALSMPGYADVIKHFTSLGSWLYHGCALLLKDTVLWWLLLLHKFRNKLTAHMLLPNKHVLASYALSSDDMVSLENIKSFDSDSQSCVCVTIQPTLISGTILEILFLHH